MQHVWGRVEVCTGFWWRILKGIDRLEEPAVDRRIILRWTFRMWDVRALIVLIWLR
jgi:hypothetical protein